MSTANVGEIVAQLKELIERIDGFAMAAMRVQKDATQAHEAFSRAGTGSEHPKIRQAITETAEAQAKAGKLARLYAEAANALTDYLNLIAPGTAPARKAMPSSGPSGEQLVTEAEDQRSRFNKVLSKQVKKADDTKDSLENAEKNGRDVINFLRQKPEGSGTPSSAQPSQPIQPQGQPHVENPIAAVILATGAMVVAGKATLEHLKKRKERKRDGADDDQA